MLMVNEALNNSEKLLDTNFSSSQTEGRVTANSWALSGLRPHWPKAFILGSGWVVLLGLLHIKGGHCQDSLNTQ